ncbi:hypothetical protein FA13DRAFT_1642380 [Coprinellus micaceus]|uniref:DUF6589 domain-containing protein n=1 Tax=Coprinellus micaceus TaxID=71717 RepID=A0A4Y7SIN1_COPMI|nr:hypothetical protein FA13DRAFT_1642380 [Coprinellus micaceus]
MLKMLSELNWTLSEFMHYIFEDRDSLSMSHAQTVSRFLKGDTKYTPASIIKLWDDHSSGRLLRQQDRDLMYSVDIPYTDIKGVRPALSSFAAQKTLEKVVKKAKVTVKPESVLETHSPLTYRLMLEVTGDVTSGMDAKKRPGCGAATTALSSLLYTRNSEARLLPLATGLLAFSYSTPINFISYCSRIGLMPAYTTISTALQRLAEHQAAAVKAFARDATRVGFIVMDNVQNYFRVRDQRIGSKNKMNIGLAATFCELRGVDPSVLSFENKQKRVAESDRASLTVYDFLSFVDFKHIETVLSFHWIRALVTAIPQLSHLEPSVTELFRMCAKKLCIPEGATPVYPLSSSGKSETVTTELKDAMHDFLSQVGQDEGDYLNRMLMVGGDGLTFQRLLEVQRYLQLEKDHRESLAILEPVLAVWHTVWTFLSSLFEIHWGGTMSPDPSSLGHNATLIGRPPPSSLKKVDFYPAIELLFLILDTRILDCWRVRYGCTNIFVYFTELAAAKKLPTIEELEKSALELHHVYATTAGIYNALNDTTIDSRWTWAVPLGKEWEDRPKNPTSLGADAGEQEEERNGRHKKGDRVLANSITFMRDALLEREVNYAIAEGDVGRVYQIMKVLLFYFAGSSHSKYCSYLLETVTRFERESDPKFVDVVLQATLVNLSGLPGACTTADLMQEYFNRLLEAIVEKKGLDYGDPFARNIISPNLGHFAQLKLNLRSGVGLAARSKRHTAPHEDPEVRKLLDSYWKHELHKRRPGRVYNDEDRDDFTRGIAKLESGRLRRWIQETTGHRVVTDGMESSPEELNAEEDAEMDERFPGLDTLGAAEIVDGRLVIRALSFADVLDEDPQSGTVD